MKLTGIGGTKYKAEFLKWESYAFDKYDWDPTKSIFVPNPDYGNPFNVANPVAQDKKTVRVYHKHAKRVEAANLAKPFDVASLPFTVSATDIIGSAEIDSSKAI